jgi:hypothetical protein
MGKERWDFFPFSLAFLLSSWAALHTAGHQSDPASLPRDGKASDIPITRVANGPFWSTDNQAGRFCLLAHGRDREPSVLCELHGEFKSLAIAAVAVAVAASKTILLDLFPCFEQRLTI